MNFKTTAVLLVVLLAVGAYLLFTGTGGKTDAPKPTPPPPALVDVKSADVTGLTVADAAGKVTLAVTKAGDKWQLTQPVRADADPYKVTSLIGDVTSAKPTNTVATAGTPTGVDRPQYTVTLTTAAGPTTLKVGDRLAVGDGVYAQAHSANGSTADSASVVPVTLLDALGRPASDLRVTQLFANATATDVKQLTITHADGTKLSLAKDGTSWKMTAPAAAPADTTAVEDLLYAVTGLTATEFVDDKSEAIGLNHPQAVVTFSTAAPTTAPTTGPTAAPATGPAPMSVTLGGYASTGKKDLFAATEDGSVVKVAASVLESLNKTPLDLRDKTVLDVDPAAVTSVSITTETSPTTKPTTKPTTVPMAAPRTVVLARRPPKPLAMGPARPTTGPSTGPTTGPATAPAAVATEWTANGADADDAKVTALLTQLHPLKAEKYLSASAIANPARRFTVTVTPKTGTPTVVHVDEPGHDLSLVGTANGLTFNLPATMATDLAGEFKRATP